MMIFSKIAINRSREGLGCEPMGRYSKKSTYQGSVYILIALQELLEATFDETRGRNSTPKKVPRAKRQIFRRLRLTVHGRVLGASPRAHIQKSLHFKGLSTSSYGSKRAPRSFLPKQGVEILKILPSSRPAGQNWPKTGRNRPAKTGRKPAESGSLSGSLGELRPEIDSQVS